MGFALKRRQTRSKSGIGQQRAGKEAGRQVHDSTTLWLDVVGDFALHTRQKGVQKRCF
jgi:hypothetical protein